MSDILYVIVPDADVVDDGRGQGVELGLLQLRTALNTTREQIELGENIGHVLESHLHFHNCACGMCMCVCDGVPC